MKIAILSSPLGYGGIASAHYNLYYKLKALGKDVVLYTYNNNTKIVPKEANQTIRQIYSCKFLNKILARFNSLLFRIIDPGKSAYQLLDILRTVISSIKLNIILRKDKPDIIVVPDHGCPGFFIRKINGAKMIWISHHNPMRFYENILLDEFSRKDAKLATKIENYALKKIDLVICPCKYMREVFQQTYFYKGEIAVVPNIILERLIENVETANLHELLGLDKDYIIIYIPSAGSYFKGSRYVFEIIRRLSKKNSKIAFYLSGNIGGILQKELNFISTDTKLFIPGQLEYNKHLSYVKACSFAISPTIIENLSMALLEASFCGLPIVAFDVGGNSEIVDDGKNGFLVPLLDIEELIDKSLKLFDEFERQQMARTSKEVFCERYSSEKAAQMFLQLLEQLK
ncbi:MAG TPA: glycosyltransferase family 4 protein [Selenomonadales bacterium]|nr:glycosyltransferase family 4 protein [Selenomonadales bacterium]